MQKKRLGIFPNLGKENVRIALPEFVQLCKDWGLEPVLPEEVAQQYGVSSYNKSEPQTLKTLDYGVSLGGDGTLLQMARHLAPLDVPAFGINFGKLGFLAEIDLQGMYKAISRLAQGNYTLESRSLLQARVICGDKLLATAHALNDLVLAKGMFSKLAHMMLFINGRLSGKYAADTPLKFFLTKDTGTNVSEKAGSYSGVAVFTAQLVAAT